MTYVPLVSAIVAIIAVALNLWYFKANRRRTQLRYDVGVDKVFSSDASLKISIDGNEVHEPHEVRLWIQPRGVKDVKATDFDSSKGLSLDLGAPLVTSPSTVGEAKLKISGSAGDSRVVVEPQLLQCGSLIYATMLVDGKPEPTISGGVADADLVEFNISESGNKSRFGKTFVVVNSFLIIVALIWSVIMFVDTKKSREESRETRERITQEITQIEEHIREQELRLREMDRGILGSGAVSAVPSPP